MNFFDHQDRSRRRSRHLVWLFGIAFLSCALATAYAAAWLLDTVPSLPLIEVSDSVPRGDWSVFLGVTAGTLLIMATASFYRTATLADGGGSIARMLGGTEIEPGAADPLQRRLTNVVEEMAIAAGVPVPEVFVLRSEAGINAFAAGLSHGDAAVAVTQGALELLDRDELQGVIAHEFSHILNGDMRLNQRLVGFSFGILALSQIGRWLMRSARYSGRGRNSGGAIVLGVGLALSIIGAIGVFFSRLIKAAVSREREYLADASAVQFTRDAGGIAAALKKIAVHSPHIRMINIEEVAHMLFGTGTRTFSGLFATHPPIMARIRALEPGFREESLAEMRRAVSRTPFAAVAGIAAARAAAAAPAAVSELPADPLERSGQMETAALGASLLSAIPAELVTAARSRTQAALLVTAMACAPETALSAAQFSLVSQRLGDTRTAVCRRLHEQIRVLDIRLRLPLLELAVPALRDNDARQTDFLLDLLRDLVASHGVRRAFDIFLPRVLEAWLRQPAAGSPRPRQSAPARDLGLAIDDLLATAATAADSGADAATAARMAGWALLGERGLRPPRSDNGLSELRLGRLDGAIERIAGLHGKLKRSILEAVLVTIRHDQRIEPAEAELLRAIAASVDVPMPPLFNMTANTLSSAS